ncbi:MAG TPA: PAS domain-containing protein [Rhizomicrobium sp.]|nr:PAS domain-containing protein [Rhizomicrobium sp.]
MAATQASRTFNERAQLEGWSSNCDESLAFARLELRSLLNVWRGFAVGERIPSCKDFTPRTLKSLLRSVAVFERVTNGKVRYRVKLMGTAFTDVMGEQSGKYLDEAMPKEFLPRWSAALDAVLEAGMPLRFVAKSDAGKKSYLVGEFLGAPLLTDAGSPTMVLAAAHFAPPAPVEFQTGTRLRYLKPDRTAAAYAVL